MNSVTIEERAIRLTARIGDPFTACHADEEQEPGKCRIHPHLSQLPGGRLVMTANIDGDIGGAEHVAYASDDGGHTWRNCPEWPRRGGLFAALEDGSSLLVSAGGLFAGDEPGVFFMPTRRSGDGGLTWEPLEGARVELPLAMDEPFDRYDPPEWFLERTIKGVSGRDYLAKWQKSQPSPAERALREQFGPRTVGAHVMQLFPLSGSNVLAFLYLSPRWGDRHITVCLASADAGRSWCYRSTPGPFDPRYETHGYLKHALDGLCEPSCTRLATGELFLVMRLGSFHPLYSTCSADEGRTWAPQADRRPGCYYADWAARPLAVYGILPAVLTLPDGTLALCTGRPDVTLSFSFDHGYHWPWTCRFLEDNKPEEQGTYNNTMIQVAANRLLLMYDHGGYHRRPPEFTGERRIVGHFIDVEVERYTR
jgi:hypothetical protein